MAQKTDFTADEWKTILASPMLAGMAVTLQPFSSDLNRWGFQEATDEQGFAH